MQINQVNEGDSGNRECNTLSAEVVGEDLAIKDHAGNIDAAAVDKKEDVAVIGIRSCPLGARKAVEKKGAYKAATPIRRPAVLGTAGIGLANDAMTAASTMRQAQQPITPVSIRGLRPTRSMMHA